MSAPTTWQGRHVVMPAYVPPGYLATIRFQVWDEEMNLGRAAEKRAVSANALECIAEDMANHPQQCEWETVSARVVADDDAGTCVEVSLRPINPKEIGMVNDEAATGVTVTWHPATRTGDTEPRFEAALIPPPVRAFFAAVGIPYCDVWVRTPGCIDKHSKPWSRAVFDAVFACPTLPEPWALPDKPEGTPLTGDELPPRGTFVKVRGLFVGKPFEGVGEVEGEPGNRCIRALGRSYGLDGYSYVTLYPAGAADMITWVEPLDVVEVPA